MIILTEGADPLSKLKNKGIEILVMNQGDHHDAWFFDGLLCGFTWFGKMHICNRYKEIAKTRPAIKDQDIIFMPDRDRAAQMFLKLYGEKGQELLDKALKVAQEN